MSGGKADCCLCAIDWQCDEQPKNTNAEGGPGAATRCMSAGENRGQYAS